MIFHDLRTIDPSDIGDTFLEKFIEEYGGTVFHEKKVNELISKYYHTRFYYLVDDIYKPNILSPLHIEQTSFKKRFHFKPLYDIPYGGFIGKYSYDLDKLQTGFFDSYTYAGIPEIVNNLINDKSNTQNLSWNETSMINLNDDLEVIFNQVIHSKRRNMIRKAEKSGIKVKTAGSNSEVFFSFLQNLHRRLGYNKLKLSFYEELLNYYLQINKAQIFVAYEEDKPLSGIMILGNKNFIHYYKGASSEDKKNEGQSELLQWEAIKWAKERSAKYYDLCVVDKKKLPELYRFKAGFTKDTFSFPVLTISGMGYKIVNKIQKILKV
jgi:hypothetical protein